MTGAATNLLWTGGYDSTHRLLMLALVYEQPVQPYYIIDGDRASVGHEIQAMLRIKSLVAERSKAARDRILPTVYAESDLVEPTSPLREDLNELRKRVDVGHQYWWIAEVLTQREVAAIEIAVKSRGPVKVLYDVCADPFEVTENGTGPVAHVSERVPMAAQRLFGRYRFPLLGLSIQQLQDTAKTQGIDDLLRHTWFCHQPRRGMPCGTCGPCQFVIADGMHARIPARRRLTAPLRRVAARCSRAVGRRLGLHS